MPRGRVVGAALLLGACGGPQSGTVDAAQVAECRGRVLTLPAQPVVVEVRGALRCTRDFVYEDEREHREAQEVIDYGPLSCMSGCPEGYEAEWTPYRLDIHPDGRVIDGETLAGHLDETGCFRRPPGESVVRWDSDGRLLIPHLDTPRAFQMRDGRLELLDRGQVEHVLSAQGSRLLVNGIPCGTIAGPPGPLTAELALRILPLADFARASQALATTPPSEL